jgi:putative ABC transport system ATP-binding protein/macrolide transport system ATP-binding/permease protein
MRRCCVPSDAGRPTYCREVSKTHFAASGPVRALSEVSLDVPAGAVTVVVGRSGSGKSTLLRLLACMDRPDDGEVIVDGVDVGAGTERSRRAVRRTAVGYVFSRPSDNLLPYLAAIEQVELAAGMRGLPRTAAPALLERLGLSGRSKSLPVELSGGERQRLAFAAAAVGNPRLLVADEPTAELDSASVAGLLVVLTELADAGSGVVVATHDPRLLDIADSVVRLDGGHVVR